MYTSSVYPLDPDADGIFEKFYEGLQKAYTFEEYASRLCPVPACALWMLTNDFVEENRNVVMLQGVKQIFSMPVDTVNCFYNLYSKIGDKAIQYGYEIPVHEIEIDKHYGLFLPHMRKGEPYTDRDSGQIKLLLNALDIIFKHVCNVLVLGGGGPRSTRSGLTYHSLAKHFPHLNFKIYDPKDTKSKGENIEVVDEYFCYDPIQETFVPDIIIDDVYFTTSHDIVWTEINKIINEVPSHYTGKFTVFREGYEARIRPSPGKHGGVGNILGGGYVQRYTYDGEVRTLVFGGSSAYGSYDRDRMKKAFPGALVVPGSTVTNLSNFMHLRQKWPEARITTKKLDRDYPMSVIRDQLYYHGNEKRVFTNNCNIITRDGVECVICHYANHASKRLKCSPEVIRAVFVEVGRESCQPHPNRTKIFVDNLIYQYCRKGNSYEDVVRFTVADTKYSEFAVRHMINNQIQSGRVKARVTDFGLYMATRFNVPQQHILSTTYQHATRLVMEYYYSTSSRGMIPGDARETTRISYIGDLYESDAYIATLYGASQEVHNSYSITHEMHMGVYIRKGLPIPKFGTIFSPLRQNFDRFRITGMDSIHFVSDMDDVRVSPSYLDKVAGLLGLSEVQNDWSGIVSSRINWGEVYYDLGTFQMIARDNPVPFEFQPLEVHMPFDTILPPQRLPYSDDMNKYYRTDHRKKIDKRKGNKKKRKKKAH